MRFCHSKSPGMSWWMAALTLLLTAIVAGTSPAVAGCPTLDEPRAFERYPGHDELPTDPPIDTSMACPTWRWVAIQRDIDSPCPAPEPAASPDWTIEPLFAGAGESFSDLPPALRPFCVYELSTDDEVARAAFEHGLESLLIANELRTIDSSCAALAPAASPAAPSTATVAKDATATTTLEPPTTQDRTRTLLHDYFLAQSEALPPVEGEASTRERSSAPGVRLALLDTQPTGVLGWMGHSDHGYLLSRITERLVCRGSADGGEGGSEDGRHCAAKITSRLALPIESFCWTDPTITRLDEEHGGYFGSIDRLARALWDELEAWRESGEKHLVLNLSVAWAGERFGGLERRVDRMPVPVQALYRALEVASCRDALVVAAAGNRTGGPEVEHGPLLPAGWERRSAPSHRRCAALLDEEREHRQKPRKDPSSKAPLVYAAGGIHSGGAPLVNSRPGAEPARVTYADHAGLAAGPTTLLTGSSVAASVVSATAAVVWHHRPELSRSEVMALVDRSGEPLGREAAVYHDREVPEVRRIGVCPALALACREGGGHCGEAGTFHCPERPAKLPELSKLPLRCTTVDLADARRFDASTLTRSMPGHDFCNTQMLHYASDGESPPDPCPSRQYFGPKTRPWTIPQPETNPCSGCEIGPPDDGGSGGYRVVEVSRADGSTRGHGHQLRIDIDPRWTGGTLSSAMLGIGETRFALGLGELEAGDCVIVENIDPALLAPGSDGFRPGAALYFKTSRKPDESLLACPGRDSQNRVTQIAERIEGSVEIPIFIGQ